MAGDLLLASRPPAAASATATEQLHTSSLVVASSRPRVNNSEAIPASVSPAASDSHKVCCSLSVRSASRRATIRSSRPSSTPGKVPFPPSAPGKRSSLLAPRSRKLIIASGGGATGGGRAIEAARRVTGESFPKMRARAATPAARALFAAAERAARVGLR
eukprot:scaffold92027_cov26-Tisochrysis_lutea.AAC.1